MKALLLLVLLSLIPYHRDQETTAQRYDRMDVTAAAIDSATLEATCEGPWESADWCEPAWPGERVELAAVLVAIGWHESTFAQHVGAGACEAWECDRGLARHYWQQHAGPWLSLDEWRQIAGVEYVPTALAAVAASRHLGDGLSRCGSVQGAIGFYANGRCGWPGAEPRMRLYRRALKALSGAT